MSQPRSGSDPGILLVANYSNRTGYAWNNIHRLFERVALESRAWGLAPVVSFARFEPPLGCVNDEVFTAVLELPPVPRSVPELLLWVRAIRRHGIRALYLTDQASWSWRYALYRLAGVRKIIVHSRVSVPDPYPALPETGPRGALKWFLARLPFMQATRIYAVSNFVRNRLVLKARLPEHRVVTILNGVDLERFAPAPQRARAGPVQLFCCGRASLHKGIQVLIEVAGLLRERDGIPDFRIGYAGDGPDLAEFRARADALGLGAAFEFLGEVPSTESLISSADIVVVPSIWGDACPSAISEALAAGKPLVATRVGGVPELIGEKGAAVMVAPNDAAELADAIERLLRSPAARRQLGEQARRRAEQALDERRYHREVIEQLTADLELGRT